MNACTRISGQRTGDQLLDDSAVAATAGSPVVSLDAFGRAVCVLNEALP
jgi:hypothetical protein